MARTDFLGWILNLRGSMTNIYEIKAEVGSKYSTVGFQGKSLILII